MNILQKNVPTTVLNFSLTSPNPTPYGPRIGNIILKRSADHHLQILTPNIITTTSRGVVPHLSRDHCKITNAILWINVPFETLWVCLFGGVSSLGSSRKSAAHRSVFFYSSLEHNPPVPTLQTGHNPLHKFLGFNTNTHLLSMSARDFYDSREMPPNGNDHTSVNTLRGVRKVRPSFSTSD